MYYENRVSRGTKLKRHSTRHVSEVTAIASKFGNSAKIIVPRSWLRPLQSRFRRLYLPPYTEEQFLEVSANVLPKLKIAHVIGNAVWDH